MGPETDDNIETESRQGTLAGLEGVRVEGEFWRDEWIEPQGFSARVRGDDDPTVLEFITGTDGTRMPSRLLDDEDIGRWLCFRPEVIKALLARRGFRLKWYTAETGGLISASGNRTHFGLNNSDHLTVYASDVARVPVWEQKIWAAYNIVPDGGVSQELLAAQVRATPADTKAPEQKLKELMKALEGLFHHSFGGPLFTHELDSRLPPISRFDGVDDASLLRLAKELNRQFADRLNIALNARNIHSRKKFGLRFHQALGEYSGKQENAGACS